ncbi:MAG: putative multidrug ABC transporter permease protein [Acidimicrobiaceae bacterium]|nr:MAG: putative multidrug ABC transporter permease protein [Acidimicrobiaceae bacterium]
MTATSPSPAGSTVSFDSASAPGGTLVRSSRGLALRGLRSIVRLPSAFLPAMMMPIVQAIAFSGTFFAITKIPGFPTDRSINWYLPLACCMGSGFSGVGMGFSTVRDLESGFFDRLRMAPSPPLSLILGPLLACWLRVMIVISTVLVVGFSFGARLTDGALGLVALYVAGLGVSTIAAGWGLGLAYVFGDMRAAALMQLTLFNALFLTNAQTPLFIMTGWLHEIARVNPFTNVLRLSRQGFLGEVTWGDTWGGLAAIVGLSAVTLWFARRGLDRLGD